MDKHSSIKLFAKEVLVKGMWEGTTQQAPRIIPQSPIVINIQTQGSVYRSSV